jgi:hypothetical protein
MPSIAILRPLGGCSLNKPLLLTIAAFAVLGLPFIRQNSNLSHAITEDGCHGLHAGLTAQSNSYTEEPTIQLDFVLLNDSELPLDSVAGPWKIIIDSKTLEDSDMIFGNGAGPAGGFHTLDPGHMYEFGKALSIVRYFPERRDYAVSWRGKGFQSPTIKVWGGLAR